MRGILIIFHRNGVATGAARSHWAAELFFGWVELVIHLSAQGWLRAALKRPDWLKPFQKWQASVAPGKGSGSGFKLLSPIPYYSQLLAVGIFDYVYVHGKMWANIGKEATNLVGKLECLLS